MLGNTNIMIGMPFDNKTITLRAFNDCKYDITEGSEAILASIVYGKSEEFYKGIDISSEGYNRYGALVNADGDLVYCYGDPKGVIIDTEKKEAKDSIFIETEADILVKYADDNELYILSKNSGKYYKWDRLGVSAVLTYLQYVGGNYFYNTEDGMFYYIKNGQIIKTYTKDADIYMKQFAYMDFQYSNGYIYYSATATTKKRFIINDEHDTMITDNSWEYIANQSCGFNSITSDGKYLICNTWNNSVSTRLSFIRITERGGEDINSVKTIAPELADFYQNEAGFSYNSAGDVLTIFNDNYIYGFQYRNDKFYKISEISFGQAIRLAISSADGMVIAVTGYNRCGYFIKMQDTHYCVADKTLKQYIWNILPATAEENVEAGKFGIFSIKTPKILDAIVEVNVDNAEIIVN